MKQCLRCGRNHSGICGIPPGVTLGFGARVGGVSSSSRTNRPIKGKPRQKPKSVSFLKEMLKQARMHEKETADMLKVVPTELPEYNELLDKLSKIERLILQLNLQIIERESK